MEQKGQRRVFCYMRVATAEQIDTGLAAKKNAHLGAVPFEYANVISNKKYEQAKETLRRVRDGV